MGGPLFGIPNLCKIASRDIVPKSVEDREKISLNFVRILFADCRMYSRRDLPNRTYLYR